MKIYVEIGNDNDPLAEPNWHKDNVVSLDNYKAPTRCAELVCVACGHSDVYVYYTKIGTQTIACRGCGHDNCLTER